MSYNLQIRLNQHEADAFFKVASQQAMELTQWVRWVCTKAAAEALDQAVEKLVPREPPRAQIVRNPNAAIKYGGDQTQLVRNPNAAIKYGGDTTTVKRTSGAVVHPKATGKTRTIK